MAACANCGNQNPVGLRFCTSCGNRAGPRRHSIDSASCWEEWRGRGTPEGIAPGHFLGGVPNRADGQDECHAATSSVFGNPAENEIGTCHAAG